MPLAPGLRNGFADKLHGNASVIIPDDLPIALDILPIFSKRSGYHHFLSNGEALSGLDINATLTYVFYGPLKKFTVGSKVCLFGTRYPCIHACFFVAHFPEAAFEHLI